MAGSVNLTEEEEDTKSRSSRRVCLLTSFSSEFLVWSEKSKVTQQRLSLETKRFSFSEVGTSLKGTKGSIPATTLEGKTAEDMRLTELDLTTLDPDGSEVESGFEDDFRGSLLRNCLNIAMEIERGRLKCCVRTEHSSSPRQNHRSGTK